MRKKAVAVLFDIVQNELLPIQPQWFKLSTAV